MAKSKRLYPCFLPERFREKLRITKLTSIRASSATGRGRAQTPSLLRHSTIYPEKWRRWVTVAREVKVEVKIRERPLRGAGAMRKIAGTSTIK